MYLTCGTWVDWYDSSAAAPGMQSCSLTLALVDWACVAFCPARADCVPTRGCFCRWTDCPWILQMCWPALPARPERSPQRWWSYSRSPCPLHGGTQGLGSFQFCSVWNSTNKQSYWDVLAGSWKIQDRHATSCMSFSKIPMDSYDPAESCQIAPRFYQDLLWKYVAVSRNDHLDNADKNLGLQNFELVYSRKWWCNKKYSNELWEFKSKITGR